MELPDAFYDDEITTFSPDGRLLQVEYAREAVGKGSTIFGIKFDSGVILIATKFFKSRLVEVQSLEKIYQIDDHIGCAISGLLADAQFLVELACVEAQNYKIIYNESIPVKELVENICEYKHLYTQFTGVRPFGIAFLIAGIDERGYHLYATDPSGAFLEYEAVTVGRTSDKAMKYLEHNYQSSLSIDAAIDFGLQTLSKSLRKKFDLKYIEIAVIEKKGKFRKLSSLEIKKLK